MADRVEAAVAAQDWAVARELFDKYRASPWRSWRRLMVLAAALMDWTVAREAETAFIAESGLSRPEDLPPPLVRIAIQARRHLHLYQEALALVRARKAKPGSPIEWTRREADILGQLGDHEAVLAIGQRAWEEGQPFGASLMSASLIELGELEDAGEILDQAEARTQAAKPADLQRLRLRWLAAKNRSAEALSLVRRLGGEEPSADALIRIAEQAAQARDLAVLDDLLQRVRQWAAEPTREACWHQAGPGILEAHYQVAVDWSRLKPLAEKLAEASLTPKAAWPLGKLILQAGEYRLADRLWRRTLALFPSAPGVWRQHLHVLSLIGDRNELEARRAEMRARFPEETYLNAMSLAEPRSWDAAELPRFISHNLGAVSPTQQNKFFASLGEMKLSDAQIAVLRELLDKGAPPLIAARIELKLLPTSDLGRLERAVREAVDFSEFQCSQLRAHRYLARLTADVCAGSFTAATNDWGMAECLRLAGEIQARRERTLLLTRESYVEAVELMALLLDRIDRREPTSLLRLGDGEGHFLPGPNDEHPKHAADRAIMLNIWWSTAELDPERFAAIEQRYVQAVEDATIIAMLPPWRYIAEMSQRKHTTVHRGILGGVHYTRHMTNKNALVTSMHFPNDFHNWNLWSDFFTKVTSVSYISCHALGSWLITAFGVLARQEIRIPGERQFINLFDEEDVGGGAETLFDRHDQICDAIRPDPGEVYLVAAGFLGKIYCDLVRLRGGVAIDIGSLADYWMGYNTRRYRLERHTEVSLANARVRGHPLTPPLDRERIVGTPALVRSTLDGRYNVAEAHASPSLPSKRRAIRIIGHPRCGIALTAAHVSARGLDVGHERLGRQGIGSWSHVVRDAHAPYGENAMLTVEFERTLLQVRDPAQAIAALLLENGRESSFNFRRLHIMRECGVDIRDYENAVDRSVASLVYWTDMALALKPDAVVTVEYTERDLERIIDQDFLRLCGVDVLTPVEDAARDHAAVLALGTVGTGEAVDAAPWSGLDAELRARLADFCDRFSYGKPWAQTQTSTG